MHLADVYADPAAPEVLYRLLEEREPHQNISHKAMPTWEEHLRFIAGRPYPEWFLIYDDPGVEERASVPIGAIYMTSRREVGLFILKSHRGQGYGTAALDMLRARLPGPILANIAPGNEPSKRFFESQGFKLIQHTYAA
jgi:RimJ/RimL family protein N-acetyltransferase